MNAIKLDQLPHLCLEKIFTYLGLRDLIKCRAVSRQFKFYADGTGLDELVVRIEGQKNCGDIWGFCTNWYRTGRPINFGYSIGPSAFSSVKSSPFKLDQQLKFLHVHLKSTADLDFKLLSWFKQLVQLEIRSTTQNNNTKPETLILPNLKVFDIRCCDDKLAYVLKTPKLEVFACKYLDKIQVQHPETIKQLVCDHHDVSLMAKFESLERLDCFCDLDLSLLSAWKNLKELNLSIVVSWLNTRSYNQLKTSLTNLIRQRTALKKNELKLYLQDVLLLDAGQLVNYSQMHDLFQLKNYRLLRNASYPQVIDVDFGRLMQLDFELDVDFFDRFPAIEDITVSEPVDSEDLCWFLENANALNSLTLENASLDQTFMDRLPNISPNLSRLEINETNPRLIVNFNFILLFKELHTLMTDRQLDSLDLAAKAFQQSNEFCFFQFRAGREFVEITHFSAIPNDYTLTFVEAEGANEGNRTLHRTGLSWPELAVLYEQRTAAAPAKRKTVARIKRARLE